MKKYWFLLSLLALMACKKEREFETCDSTTCTQYQTIWENLLMERNSIPQAWFDEHIQVLGTELRHWDDNDRFTVAYKITIGWASILTSDQLPVRIDSNVTLYPAVLVPRGPFLSQDEIAQTLGIRAFNASMNVIAPVEDLKFKTKAAAVRAMEDAAGRSVKVGSVSLWHGVVNFPSNGHLTLDGYASIDGKANRCLSVSLDLVSGYVRLLEGQCWID